MPKKSTGSKMEQFSISLPIQALDMIEKLVPIGLYGNSRGEVARALILSRLEQIVRDGILYIKEDTD